MSEIVLPWPVRELSPNSRCHWAVKAKAVKSARTTAAWITKAAKVSVNADVVTLKFMFHPPDNRRRDIDGMFSSCKAAIDGIADALCVNDNCFRYELELGGSLRGGMVKVFIK